jgi:sodium/hydrogen antiporter
VGLGGALLVALTTRVGWSAPGFRPLAVLALAVLAYSVALLVSTNGFVAAFVAGIAFGTILPTHADVLAFTEEASTLLSLLVWFSFGAVMLVPGLQAADWRDALFAVLALTVVRMVPVTVALAGSGFDRATVAFVGWFGPRGMASVVFGLIAVDALDRAAAQVVLGAVVVTVALSVLAHGVTAAPLGRRYGLHASGFHPQRPEHHPGPISLSATSTPWPERWRRLTDRRLRSITTRGHHDPERQAISAITSCTVRRRRQNSLPSGSAKTTQVTSGP